jgi:hypothetical protein
LRDKEASGGIELKKLKAFLLIGSLLFLTFFSPVIISCSKALDFTESNLNVYVENDGVRVVFSDVELFFNASNGGEITEYYDLLMDPDRSSNLVNLGWEPYGNLLPLFSSLFYLPHVFGETVLFSTGGDNNAVLRVIANNSQYVVLQASSRIMNKLGQVARDANGNIIHVNSIWVIRNDGLVSVERTLSIPTYASIPSGWRWYPFYLTRNAGFYPNATFCLFNSTYVSSSIVNATSYINYFEYYPVIPKDTEGVFGVAVPFCNTSIGGDGTHNIIIAYKYDELIGVDEWRSDNYYSDANSILEAGSVYEFPEAFYFSTHTYHALVSFSHQQLNDQTLTEFADYYADNPFIAPLMEVTVSSAKDTYTPGEYFAFLGSGVSYYNLADLIGKITVNNSLNNTVYQRNYGPGSTTAGQAFSIILLSGTVQPLPDDYTFIFQISSKDGVLIASSTKTITIKP